MKDLSVQFLTPAHKDEIVALRKECYLDYYGSRLDPKGLDWNYTDQHSIHLSFVCNNKIVSYLRLSLFNDQLRLEKNILFSTPKEARFPVGLLARAATKKELSNLKLHNTLRTIALDMCVKLNTNTILGSLEERSARLESLLGFGYRILDRQPEWPGSYIQSTGPVVLVGLCNRDEIFSAAEKMKLTYPISHQVKPVSEVSYL